MKFKVVIIFTNQTIERFRYESKDIYEAIKDSINKVKKTDERRIIETIMIEFLDKGLEI